MNQAEYDLVELPAIEQLCSLGWTYINGKDLAPDITSERKYWGDVILEDTFNHSIQALNPWINDENLRKVTRSIIKPQVTSLTEANQSFWNTITSHISVEQDLGKGRKGQTVKLIDFDNASNNSLICVNQFKVKGPNQSIIPDIILFVNGLPLVVIECKSPYIVNPMESGIEQLLRYSNRRTPLDNEGAEKLFYYNQLMISTYRDKARVGTISSSYEYYLEWKDPYPVKLEDGMNSQQVLIHGLLNPSHLLDIIRNFTTFDASQGKTVKKIARYQQFRAVHKTIERLKESDKPQERGGVIWHTQGSGKSLTMVFLAIKMRRDTELSGYKLVFLTDRKDLDGQLTNTFRGAQEESIYQAKSISELKTLLSRDAADIVTATVQKFQERESAMDFPVLNESSKIIILSDEAHRTQYGGLGVAINTALPNAAKVGFTGTPLIKSQKTQNAFGSYIDTYTIDQAVKDGATNQIVYEGREAVLKVTGDSLDGLFDEYFSDKTTEEKEAIKRKYGTQQAVLEAPQRIQRICLDIIKHYKEHIAPNGFKGMIITSSRNAAVTYKEQLDAVGDGLESAVIISGSHNDEARFNPYTDRVSQDKAIADFKKPYGTGEGESTLSFLIVKDMLLTGFDAPIAQVLYLDKKMVEHNLLQAIARVNRTAKNKSRGYVVDYYGLSDYLQEALDVFSDTDVEGALVSLKDEIPELKSLHTKVIKYFKGMKLTDVDTCVSSLSDEAHRQNFEQDFRAFTKQLEVIMPDVAAKHFINDAKALGRIMIAARNLYREESLNITGAGEKVRRLIEEHVRSLGIDPKIPPIQLLDGNFVDQVNSYKEPKVQASDIESAIKQHITVNIAEDPEYYKKLSERLEDIIKQHDDKWEQLVIELLELRSEISNDESRNSSPVDAVAAPFYNILKAELPEVDEAMVIELTQDLYQEMKNASELVDFFNKWDEVRTLQKLIKRKLIAKGLNDRLKIKVVIDRLIELAKVKFN